jgi:hypothetical protein
MKEDLTKPSVHDQGGNMQFGANFPNPAFKDLDEDEGFKPS